jgi:peptide/nickel transport system substrate-binding protein
LWSYTLRRTGEEGGVFTIAMPSMLDNPWNPVAGSNWVYDMSVIRAVSDWALIPDPYTGLALPQRLVLGEVVIETGLPVGVTYDWVDLSFEDTIEVPADAWIDWDAAAQTFITVGEAHPDGLTAKSKVVCHYGDELLTDSLWHDGSLFSLGDIVMYMILNFDLAKEASPYFDQGQVATVESWLAGDFRGWRIVSEDPVVVEYYSDAFQLDAELNLSNGRCGWPEYAQGQGAWHTMALALMAEADQTLAFTTAKSTELEIEWTNLIGGPSLEVLAANLDTATAETFIPFAPTLGQYITADDAAARYANLAQFYADFSHFWVGNGPMYMESVYPIEKTVTLQNFANFPDLASKWSGYAEPKLADVEIDGPGRVVAGEAASFEVFVTFHGEDYPLSEIDNVTYLLFDATGAVVDSGFAVAVDDGYFTIDLTGDQTDLESGASRIEVIVVPIVVSIPTLEAFEFVVE